MPSFLRLASWNIAMFVCYEQLKRAFADQHQSAAAAAAIQHIDIRIPKTEVAWTIINVNWLKSRYYYRCFLIGNKTNLNM